MNTRRRTKRLVSLSSLNPRLCRPVLLAFLAGAALGMPASSRGEPPRYAVTLFPSLNNLEFAAPFGLNEDGAIVGYAAPEPYHPLSIPLVVSAAGDVASLPMLDKSFNFLNGMNEQGDIAGESGRRACLWRGGEARPLIVPDGVFSGAARDINNAGILCGSYGDSDEIGPHHCVWTDPESPPLTLPGVFLGITLGAAWEVNEAGQIAGVSGGIEGAFVAARWDGPEAEPVRIDPLAGAMNSEGLGLNELGDVVGRSSFPDFTTEAIFFDAELEEVRGLGFLDGGEGYSEARDVNSARQVVGVARAGEGIVHAVLWEEGAIHDLNDLVLPTNAPIRYLQSAWAINDAGLIAVEAVVEGDQPDFPRRIALLTPVRAPFRRGDCDGDGQVTGIVTDAIFLLSFNFLWVGFEPPCLAACDVNGDGEVRGVVSDAISLLTFNFLSGPPPVAPFPDCGPGRQPGDEALGCVTPPASCQTGG